MRIVLDELNEAKRLLTSPKEKYKEQNLIIIAKYLREEGVKPAKIKARLIEYCKQYDPNWNEVNNYKKLKRIINKTKTYRLRRPSPIYIKLKELEIIHSIQNYDMEKFLFVLLVYAKVLKYNPTRKIPYKKPQRFSLFFVGEKETRLFDVAHVYIRKDRRRKELKKLYDLGLLDKTETGKFLVKYVFDDSPIEIIVNDYRDVVLYYQRWLGERVVGCSCGRLFLKRGNNHQTCRDCQRKARLEKKKAYNQKYYKYI